MVRRQNTATCWLTRTTANVITDEHYRLASDISSANLQFFGHDPALDEKLRILLIADPYFQTIQRDFVGFLLITVAIKLTAGTAMDMYTTLSWDTIEIASVVS